MLQDQTDNKVAKGSMKQLNVCLHTNDYFLYYKYFNFESFLNVLLFPDNVRILKRVTRTVKGSYDECKQIIYKVDEDFYI